MRLPSPPAARERSLRRDLWSVCTGSSAFGFLVNPFRISLSFQRKSSGCHHALRKRLHVVGSILLEIGTTHEKSLPIARCRCPCLGFIPAVNLLMQWESRRQSCLKIDLFSSDGVVEFQILGVQEISSIAGEAGEIFKRLAA